MAKTSIEWATDSWNPIRARSTHQNKLGWYCQKVSSGCANCYAEKVNLRFGNVVGYHKANADLIETFIDYKYKTLVAPLRWKKPRTIFVCSMTDLFGAWVTDEQIDREFADVYLEEYCNVRNTRPDFKKETLATIKEIVGDVKLRQFSKADAHRFEVERRRRVAAATVNRLPVDERAMRVMEPGEARLIVAKTIEADPVVGAYVGILGETGLRMTEGLELRWEFVSVGRGQLTVGASKNYKTRHVPLSRYAVELLRTLPRIVGNPHVFVQPLTMSKLRAPRRPFLAGKKAAGIEWPGFHDFRHYRATQWIKHGVDIRTVKEWMGHRDIQTTMRYLHFVGGHAQERFRLAEQAELRELDGNLPSAVGEE